VTCPRPHTEFAVELRLALRASDFSPHCTDTLLPLDQLNGNYFFFCLPLGHTCGAHHAGILTNVKWWQGRKRSRKAGQEEDLSGDKTPDAMFCLYPHLPRCQMSYDGTPPPSPDPRLQASFCSLILGNELTLRCWEPSDCLTCHHELQVTPSPSGTQHRWPQSRWRETRKGRLQEGGCCSWMSAPP
jgi:hypothetical protein